MNTRAKLLIVLLAVLVGIAVFVFLNRPSPPLPRTRSQPQVTRQSETREFVGIGLALKIDPVTKRFVVDGVVRDTPAADAQLKRGSIVSKVDDVPLEGKSLSEGVQLIRGPVDSTVKLEVISPDGQTNVVELTRRSFKV